MSNYTKTTDFAAKDALLTGNPSKLVKGTEINVEFSNIQTAVNSKLDSSGVTAFAATLLDDIDAATARGTLGAAKSGANADITSITGNAATATTAAACSGNAATATTAASCSGNAATATTAASCSGNAATATTASNALGVGQSWTDFTGLGTRLLGTNYTNSTGRTIIVSVAVVNAGVGSTAISIDGIDGMLQRDQSLNDYTAVTAAVPTGSVYNVRSPGYTSVTRWTELR